MATYYSSMPPAPTPFIAAWAAAIYSMEGPGPGTLATRQNNPGNIVVNGTFAVYPTITAGWKALYSDLAAKIRKYPSWTFDEIMGCANGVDHCYAPGSAGYGAFVAQGINAALGTNFSASTPIGTAAAVAAGGSYPNAAPSYGSDPAVSDDGGLDYPADGYPGDDSNGTAWSWWPWAAAGVVGLYVMGEL